MNAHLDFLLSSLYDELLHPEHASDLAKSGITEATRRTHKIRTVPPAMLRPLGISAPPGVESALLFPFPDPPGGFMDYVKVRIFPELADRRGDHVEEQPERYRYNKGATKYLTRRRAAPRLYFPMSTIPSLQDTAPIWCIEGMKKALSVAQLGLPAFGIESVWTWREKGSRELLPDFRYIRLTGRIVELMPDADVQSNPAIARAMRQLADALRAAGARPRLVRLPETVPT
jgi:hypothetical protein